MGLLQRRRQRGELRRSALAVSDRAVPAFTRARHDLADERHTVDLAQHLAAGKQPILDGIRLHRPVWRTVDGHALRFATGLCRQRQAVGRQRPSNRLLHGVPLLSIPPAPVHLDPADHCRCAGRRFQQQRDRRLLPEGRLQKPDGRQFRSVSLFREPARRRLSARSGREHSGAERRRSLAARRP